MDINFIRKIEHIKIYLDNQRRLLQNFSYLCIPILGCTK